MSDAALPAGGRYLDARPLGKGGMGLVYQARDSALGRDVALKRLMLAEVPLSRRADTELRFQREFHTLARLRHPNIVQAFDYGSDAQGPYYTMELLDGDDLQALAPVDVGTACRLLRDVASALSFLHARRLVHRDLGARNVRRTSSGIAKLIDFGVIATFGTYREVAGTAPFMAPENLRGMPLDARTDLYSLGALAYFLLTGRHAYPVKELEALPQAWRVEPPHLDVLVPNVPSVLVQLVLSLLSLEAARRPASCTEVVERLTAIAGLEPLPVGSVARGTLASAPCVGREAELGHFRSAAQGLFRKKGAAVVVKAPSGMGKTRLLAEMALEAQLAGAVVVRAEAPRVDAGPYGTLRELAKSLVARAPETVGAPGAEVAARALPELQALMPNPPLPPLDDPMEERIAVQRGLVGWLASATAQRPLALVVDDVQRADESSAAALAGLALECGKHPLLLVCGHRTDEPTRAEETLGFLENASRCWLLGPLDDVAVGELLRGLFGEVRHLEALTQHVASLAAGSPLAALEVAGHLVETGAIRFEQGTWHLPQDFGRTPRSASLRELVTRQLDRLSPEGRGLAETLAVHTGESSLALAVALSGLTHAQAFAALDELLEHGVLVGAEGSYRFRHDAVREGLSDQLFPERQRTLHARLAEALLAQGAPPPELEEDVGWHLLQAGDERRGAAFLERAAQRLFDAQAFTDAVPLLKAVLEAKQKHGAPPGELLELQYRLVYCGGVVDQAAVLENAESAVLGYARYAGMFWAERLSPYLGRTLAVLLGLAFAGLRWLATPKAQRGPTPLSALVRFITAASASAISLSALNEGAKVERIRSLFRPLATSPQRIPYAIYLLIDGQLTWLRGRWHECVEGSRQMQHILQTDRKTPIRDVDRAITDGFATLRLAGTAAFGFDRAALDRELEHLASLKLQMFEPHILQMRGLYHRLRGDEAAALALEAQVDAMALQTGPSWTSALVRVLYLSIPCVLTDDAVGLRQCLAELERLSKAGGRFEEMCAHLSGELERSLGQHERARETLGALFQKYATQPNHWLHGALAVAMAESYLAEHRFAEARPWVDTVLRADRFPGALNYLHDVRMTRAEALCLGGEGKATEGLTRVQAALEEARRRDNPLASGLLHETAAELCTLTGDRAAFQRHLAAADLAYSQTSHARLLGRLRLLSGGETRPGSDESSGDFSATLAQTVATVETGPAHKGAVTAALLDGCHTEAERYERVLDMLRRSVQATEAYLLSSRGRSVSKLAPASAEPPPTLLGEVSRLEAETFAHAKSTTPLLSKAGFWLIPLERDAADQPLTIVALSSPATPDPGLVAALAEELSAGRRAML